MALDTAEQVNSRNCYRQRQFDTRVGMIEARIPKLLRDHISPIVFLQRRWRAEPALVSVVTVVATSHSFVDQDEGLRARTM